VNDFVQRVAQVIASHRLLTPGQRVLAAVSGGVDSMVLLYALDALAEKNRWHLAVAHFNHRLRGRASQADAALVRQTAKALGWPCFSGSGNVSGHARRMGISVEMAARQLRHEFLARTAREQKISIIALAHHADDQVELFFLRLLRGAGGEGLAGMKQRSPSPADSKITLIRPLIGFPKTELRAFAGTHSIRFREDATNFANDALRNRLRNELLPLLVENYQPGLAATVSRTMDIVGAETEFAAATARAWLADTRRNRPAFARLPLAIQRQALQQQLAALGVNPDFELIEHLRREPKRPVSAGAGQFLLRESSGVVVWHQPPNRKFDAASLTLDLAATGTAEFAGKSFRWGHRSQRRFNRPRPQAGTETFDADKVGPVIRLRHWQPGDRFQPIGLPSAAKLQDLFVNAKVPARQRRERVVAATAGGVIFWVEGLRLGEPFKLTPATRRKLVWQWR